jgi:hypothetical protein
LFGPKFQDPLYSLLLYIFLLKTKYPFNKSKICCQGRVAFGLLNINFLFYIVGIITIPMIIGSFSGFLVHLNNLDKWEELNYLIIFIPTFSSFLTAIYFKIQIK